MEHQERTALIERYRAGVAAVHAALAPLDEPDLDRVGPDGGWSARMVVHHLADSEMTSAIRLRRLLTEPAAEIVGYDEREFARRLWYDKRPIDASLKAFDAARETTSELLDAMTDADWSRAGTHTEHGAYSALDWLQIYADHAFDHAEQITRAAGVAATAP